MHAGGASAIYRNHVMAQMNSDGDYTGLMTQIPHRKLQEHLQEQQRMQKRGVHLM